jgi:hypothetical protein
MLMPTPDKDNFAGDGITGAAHWLLMAKLGIWISILGSHGIEANLSESFHAKCEASGSGHSDWATLDAA